MHMRNQFRLGAQAFLQVWLCPVKIVLNGKDFPHDGVELWIVGILRQRSLRQTQRLIQI